MIAGSTGGQRQLMCRGAQARMHRVGTERIRVASCVASETCPSHLVPVDGDRAGGDAPFASVPSCGSRVRRTQQRLGWHAASPGAVAAHPRLLYDRHRLAKGARKLGGCDASGAAADANEVVALHARRHLQTARSRPDEREHGEGAQAQVHEPEIAASFMYPNNVASP